MEVSDLLPLVEQLDDNVDEVEEVIAPLLNRPLTETSKKLPVLDRAKLHAWTVYALESIIFSYLRLHGVNAKQHPVFRELTRVKQYFDKIKALETEPEQRTMTVDKQAAGRFIKHGLAGNDRLDLERKEQEAKSKARAQLKASALAKKAESKKPSGQAKDDSNEDATSDDSDEEKMDVEPAPTADTPETTQAQISGKKRARKEKRKAKAEKADQKQDKKEEKKSKKERRERKLQKRKAREAKENSKSKNEA